MQLIPTSGKIFFLFCLDLGEVIICGDFNGHCSLWSLPNINFNEESRKIERVIETSNCICLNNKMPI